MRLEVPANFIFAIFETKRCGHLQEKDPKFDVEVSRSNKELFLQYNLKLKTEIYLIKARSGKSLFCN